MMTDDASIYKLMCVNAMLQIYGVCAVLSSVSRPATTPAIGLVSLPHRARQLLTGSNEGDGDQARVL